MPLINFQSTNYIKAFILYALVAALATSISVHLRVELDNKESGIYKFISPIVAEKDINDLHKFFITLIITFFASFIIYHIMYFLLGWGGGMIVNKTKVQKLKYI